MPEKDLIRHIKQESNSDILYLVAVTCLERLVKMEKSASVKAIVDAGTTGLFKLIKK